MPFLSKNHPQQLPSKNSGRSRLRIAWHRSLFMHAVLLSLFINPLFWVASLFVDFERPFINVDYFIVLMVAAMSSRLRLAAVPLLIIFLWIDSLSVISTVFTLMTVDDLIYMMKFISFTNVYAGYWVILGVALIFIIMMYLVSQSLAQRLSASDWLTLFLSLILLVFLDRLIVIAQTYHTSSEWINYRNNVALDSQSVYLFKQKYTTGFRQFLSTESETGQLTPWHPPTASSVWFNELKSASPDLEAILPRYLILIVVESWGLPIDDDLNRQIYPDIEALKSLPGITVLNQGRVAYEGPTIRAEVRELCQAVPSTLRIQGTDIQNWPCLPKALAKLGYQTWSISASSRSMYDAGLWYPLVGIQYPLFLEDHIQVLGRCYSWPAGCDDQYFPIIQQQIFQTSGKHFIYWMTSTSHFPYDSRDAIRTDYQCKNEMSSQLCNYAKIHSRFFSALRQFLHQQSSTVEIVLVGDHRPPFADKSVEKQFSATHVPFLHLYWSPRS